MMADGKLRDILVDILALRYGAGDSTTIAARDGNMDMIDVYGHDVIEAMRLTYNAAIDECLSVAENVCYRATEDDRAKDGRVRCSVDDLLNKIAALKGKV